MLGAEIKQLDMAWNGCQGQGQGHEAKTNLDSHGQSEKLSAVADAALPATKLPEPEVFLRAVSAVESMAKSTGSIEGRVSEIVKLLVSSSLSLRFMLAATSLTNPARETAHGPD